MELLHLTLIHSPCFQHHTAGKKGQVSFINTCRFFHSLSCSFPKRPKIEHGTTKNLNQAKQTTNKLHKQMTRESLTQIKHRGERSFRGRNTRPNKKIKLNKNKQTCDGRVLNKRKANCWVTQANKEYQEIGREIKFRKTKIN